MLKVDSFSSHHFIKQGLNKISLVDQDYTQSLQNKIIDLKLTCSIYK